MKLLSLPTDANPRIVSVLEDALAKARAGKVVGIFLYTEDDEGNIEHCRDGMPDHRIIFSLELVKKRILARYA